MYTIFSPKGPICRVETVEMALEISTELSRCELAHHVEAEGGKLVVAYEPGKEDCNA